ncbi:hypothetical protein CB1_000149002 [Camelus ferus]|nr:hypothetical protein CB1_000149002 [Camelus ferus]
MKAISRMDAEPSSWRTARVRVGLLLFVFLRCLNGFFKFFKFKLTYNIIVKLYGVDLSSNFYQIQGASFRGWKDVTSLSYKDDEQHLLERRRPPKSRGTNLRLKEELKTEKKSGFWDNLVLKQNTQTKKPDEIEGWEPPTLALEDVAADSGDTESDRLSRPGWEEGAKGSKYTSLAGAGNSSRWSLRSAGKLVSIRRQSRGHLTDNWEELE